jgi:signal transduction histidine kinase
VRRRLLASTLIIAVAIVILFGVPLGVVLDRAVHADARSRLQREAVRVAREVARDIAREPDAADAPTPAELARLVPSGDRVQVIAPNRTVSSDQTPVIEALVATAPGPDGSQVRVETPSDPINSRVARALLALVLLGVLALGAALGLALIQSRRLSDPLARLARSATRLGDGDFSLVTPRSGVPEIDEIASSLDRSAERIDELLRAERSFSEHASHQLRTALTGLQLRIEELASSADPAVREEAEAALEQSARLTSIIEELLALARTGRTGIVRDFDLGDLVRQHVDDLQPLLARSGRRAIVVAPEPVPVKAALGAIGQVLDILLSNSGRHGAGRVTATVSTDGRRARVDVTDEGSGFAERDTAWLFTEQPDASGHGIGLALARRLITTEGGTITLLQASPPVFRVELLLG